MNTLTTTKARMMIDPIFRRFIIIDILDTFTIGIAAAVLPLFIIEKFGRSSELALLGYLVFIWLGEYSC